MKKRFLFATLIATVAVAGTAAFALAQTQNQGSTNNEHGADQGHGNGQQKMMLTIDPSGRIMLRGTLISGGNTAVGSSTSATSATTLVVKSWGITFTVNTASKDISHFNNGDLIGVIGTIDPITQIITARVVRDWSLGQGNVGMKKHSNNDDQNHNDHGSTTPRMGHDGENRNGPGRQ